jgi:GTP-binding protein
MAPKSSPEIQFVKSATFIKSAVWPRAYPDPESYPEIAVAGRSNVGKSSLINKLTNRR